MRIVCLDLEGVLIPEVWINFAERTGIEELRLTTRDIPDYDELMTRRLAILDEHGLGLPQIQEVIDGMEPLPGAADFLAALRASYQLVILSDTFYEFAEPFMRKLGWPTLFCHSLQVAADGHIEAYRLRQQDQKRKAVAALKDLAFQVVASGDSYNDTTMLAEAHAGILFRAPNNVIAEFPQYPHTTEYPALRAAIDAAFESLAEG
ncbi:MAG: bifunctional phosphoserine phosphatase/homoserine phosphotransferase ThrH [Myxococcales bacterium]|nr:bifunctional phosphoserine phosphatase/homoserine phosphotransferase ThrH [Myxococcales bacterium]